MAFGQLSLKIWLSGHLGSYLDIPADMHPACMHCVQELACIAAGTTDEAFQRGNVEPMS